MMVNELLTIFKKNPVIPCTSNLENYANEDYNSSKVILLYDFTIFDLKKFKHAACEFNKFTNCTVKTNLEDNIVSLNYRIENLSNIDFKYI